LVWYLVLSMQDSTSYVCAGDPKWSQILNVVIAVLL